jgi:hypothetical protein
MKNSITWVVNFCDQDYVVGRNDFFKSNWCKYSNSSDLFDLKNHDFSDQNLIIDYFENQNYKELLLRFWQNDDAISIEKFNLIIISDRENLYQATLFSYYFKRAADFLVNVGLSARTYKKSYLINFWEHAWSNDDYDKNMNALYELTLFQNLNAVSRPYDLVLIYKNTNEGISNIGKYWETNDQNYHSSRIIQLVSFLSTAGTNSIVTKNIEQWCRAFGGLLIYSDAEKIYKIQAHEVSNMLLNHLKHEEKGLWGIDFGKIKLEQTIENINATKIFQEISAKVSVIDNIETYNITGAWHWFSLEKLKTFFEDFLKMNLFKTKESKISFIFKSYKEVKDRIEVNLEKTKLNTGKSGIPSPQQIFNDYFQAKPFSVASLKVAVIDLISQIDKKRKDHQNLFKMGYSIDGKVFMPFSLDSDSCKEFDYISEQFGNHEDSRLNEEEAKILDSIEKKSAEIPHPVALLFKTFFLSTLILMFTFIPLKILLKEDAIGQIITYLSLTTLFITPFYLVWRKYKFAIETLSQLKMKFEVFVKYSILRRTNRYIYLKIDEYFDDYLKRCKAFLEEIEFFCKQSELITNSLSSQDHPKVPLCSVKSISEIVNEIPIPKITIERDGYIVNTTDLAQNTEHIFKLFDLIVRNQEIGLTDILKNAHMILSNKIALNIENTPGNTNLLSEIVFLPGNNLKKDKCKELLDVIPPFNGIISDEIISVEVSCVVSENEQVKKNIREFLSPLNITDYIEKYEKDGINGELNILSLNTPGLGVKTLFSLNIKESFYDRTQKYFNTNKDRLDEILDKVYFDIVQFFGESLPNKFIDSELVESSYKRCFKGFDGGFEVDFENIRIDFSKIFKEYNEEKINSRVSMFLQGIYRNDSSKSDLTEDTNS